MNHAGQRRRTPPQERCGLRRGNRGVLRPKTRPPRSGLPAAATGTAATPPQDSAFTGVADDDVLEQVRVRHRGDVAVCSEEVMVARSAVRVSTCACPGGASVQSMVRLRTRGLLARLPSRVPSHVCESQGASRSVPEVPPAVLGAAIVGGSGGVVDVSHRNSLRQAQAINVLVPWRVSHRHSLRSSVAPCDQLPRVRHGRLWCCGRLDACLRCCVLCRRRSVAEKRVLAFRVTMEGRLWQLVRRAGDFERLHRNLRK